MNKKIFNYHIYYSIDLIQFFVLIISNSLLVTLICYTFLQWNDSFLFISFLLNLFLRGHTPNCISHCISVRVFFVYFYIRNIFHSMKSPEILFKKFFVDMTDVKNEAKNFRSLTVLKRYFIHYQVNSTQSFIFNPLPPKKIVRTVLRLKYRLLKVTHTIIFQYWNMLHLLGNVHAETWGLRLRGG